MTINQIAVEAGVSISTVSRVLNTPEKVSPLTRARVQEVLARNNYVPNAFARGLVQSTIKSVGILTSDIRTLYHAIATHVLEDAFFSWGYTSYFCPAGNSVEKKLTYIRTLSEKRVDGLILIGSVFSSPVIEKHLRDYMPNTPIATINGWLSGDNIYTISLNQDIGMELILNHLQEKGYENIYFVAANVNQNTEKKILAFKRYTESRGIPLNENHNIFYCEYTFESISAFAKDFLPLTKKKTAIIFRDELCAGYAYRAFRALGLSIPDDVAIVGYDNVYYPLFYDPPITTLDTQIEVLSSLAANTLHDIFSQKPVSQNISVAPKLVIRSST